MTRASDTAKLLGAGATILDGTTISTADNTTQLQLISTDADAGRGSVLDLIRNSESPADNDLCGTIRGLAKNDAGQDVVLSEIIFRNEDVTDGTEDGQIIINCIRGGAATGVMKMASTETIMNYDQVDLDFRVASDDNANMLFVDGGNNKIGVNTNSPDAIFTVDSNVGGSSTGTLARFHSSKGESDSTYLQIAATRHGTASVQRVQLQAFDDDGSTGRTLALNPSGGNVGVGTNTPEATFAVTSAAEPMAKFHQTATTDVGAVIMQHGRAASSTSAQMVAFLNGAGTLVGSINLTGSATAYATSSDYRLKENVVTDWDATTRLKQLKPSRFNFKADADTTVDGFLAHEVSSIVPEAIHGAKDATRTVSNGVFNSSGIIIAEGVEQDAWTAGKLATKDADGNDVAAIYPSNSTWSASKDVPVYQGIDQSKIVPLLVKTIQELEARITALES